MIVITQQYVYRASSVVLKTGKSWNFGVSCCLKKNQNAPRPSESVVVVVFFTLTDRASTIPSNIYMRGCQSGTWSCPLHINSECEKERRILLGPWRPAKAAPVWDYFEVYWPCAGGFSAVNAIGTQLRDLISSGLTRWRTAV